ncbi:MAG: dTDP-4-dehydrorhamnose 3,5-epimerase family protein, partial [Deltaproteobacteria bacterium]|nr:dTDP-4-dehydrorhamnose 3,5-epimerase family protein [Deltaproteobacteria bacterium]
MIITETTLPGVLLIKREIFEDHRGSYRELYSEKLYKESGVGVTFVEDDISSATKGVLKGIHGDEKT